MKVEFLKRFSKDLDEIPVKSIKSALKRVVELMENTDNLSKIPGTKNFRVIKLLIEQESEIIGWGFSSKMKQLFLPVL